MVEKLVKQTHIIIGKMGKKFLNTFWKMNRNLKMRFFFNHTSWSFLTQDLKF